MGDDAAAAFSPADLIAKWEGLLADGGHVSRIAALVDGWPERRSLEIPFNEVDRYDPAFALQLLGRPAVTLEAGEEAVIRLAPPHDQGPRIHLRVYGLPEDASIDVEWVRTEHVGRFVSVEGVVAKLEQPRSKVVGATFRCIRCNATLKEDQEGMQLREPLECYKDQGGCERTAGKTRFQLLGESSTQVDVQDVEIRDPPGALRSRGPVWTLPCLLEDDLVGSVHLDGRVVLEGILRTNTRQEARGTGRTTVLDKWLQVVSVEAAPQDEETRAAETAAAAMSRDDALERIAKVFRVPDERDYITILIWAAQAHLISLFDSVFYLAFRGKTGSGKGTGVEVSIALTPDGESLGSATPAYMASVLDEGKAIGLQEADRLVHKFPDIETLLRNGYRRGVTYGFMIPVEGKEWVRASRSLFGPKVYDFHTSFDTHMLGRSIVVDLEADDSVDRAMDAEKKVRQLRPVRMWLSTEAERALKVWTKEKVEALWNDVEFRHRVSSMGGSTGRDHVIAANMLLVCDVLGWDYGGTVHAILSTRRTIDEYGDEQEVLDALQAIVSAGPSANPEIPVEQLLMFLNDARNKLRLRPMTPRGLARVLRDVGFRRGNDWERAKSGQYRDRTVLRPARVLSTILLPAQGAQGAQSDGAPSIWSGPTVNGQDGQDGQAKVSPPPTNGQDGQFIYPEVELKHFAADEGQDPDYMLGLQRGLDLVRTGSKLLPFMAAADLEKELRARGHVPDPAKIREGLERGLRGQTKKDGGEADGGPAAP